MMRKLSDLSKQQIQACRDAINMRSMCITSDCGFGKTAVLLTVCKILIKKYPKIKALIVSTSKGVNDAWSKEHLLWEHTADLSIAILNGDARHRKTELNKKTNIDIISYNNVKWLCNNTDTKYDIVIADELHNIKSPTSVWRKNLMKLSIRSSFRLGASATPKPNTEIDYFGTTQFLDGGKALGVKNITEFRNTYCMPIMLGDNNIMYKVRSEAKSQIEEKVKHLFVNYELPVNAKIPIQIHNVNVKLSSDSAAIYETLEREQCLNSIVVDDNGRINTDDSLSAIQLRAKLTQLSSGFIYVDDALRIDYDTLKYAVDSDTPIDIQSTTRAISIFADREIAVKKLVDKLRVKHGNVPIAIVYHFKYELEVLQKLFPSGVSDKDFSEDEWNEGKIDYLFLQYQRSSESLNLQRSTNVMVLYSLTFNWKDYYQIMRRIARQGQQCSQVDIYRLIIMDTVDSLKLAKLNGSDTSHRNFQKKILKYIASKQPQDVTHNHMIG